MIELTCADVVPLIALSGSQLDLVVSRRPSDVQLTDCPAAPGAGAPRQVHSVVDEANLGHSLDGKNMKEDAV